MIGDLPRWWAFLTYGGSVITSMSLKVGEEEAGTSIYNQAYDKFQAKQDKSQTGQLLELKRRKVLDQINQWHLIMMISIAIQNIPSKVWKYYFVAVNFHPHHLMNFPDWINNISPDVNTGETAYFWNHEGSYYDVMPSVWKNMSVPIRRDVMFIIDLFFKEAPPGKSPWTKENILSLIRFSLLTKYSRSRYAIW